MAEHGHTNEQSGGHKTISEGSTNQGIFMKTFEEVITGIAETVSEGTTANVVKFLDSAAKDFPPGSEAGGSGGHSAPKH